MNVYIPNIQRLLPTNFRNDDMENMQTRICAKCACGGALEGFRGMLSDVTENFLRLSLARRAHTHTDTLSWQASMLMRMSCHWYFDSRWLQAKIKPNGNTNFHDYVLLNAQLSHAFAWCGKLWGEKCKFPFTKWQFAETMREVCVAYAYV